MSLGGHLRRVTTRLLATVLLVTVVSVSSSAWVANWQANQRFQQSLRREQAKQPMILERLAILARESAWPENILDEARRLSAQTGLRITVTSEDPTFRIDLDETHPDRLAQPADKPRYTIDPSALKPDGFKSFAIRNSALRLCYDTASIAYDLVKLESGLQRPVAKAGQTPNAAVQVFNCRRLYDDAPETSKPVYVALSELSLDDSALLGNGVRWRLVGIIAGLLALAVATTVILARQILRPVGMLTAATQRMRGGNLSERVPVTSTDELGQLSESFNAMASSLEESDKLRKRMTSDIAHELRTPLSNIRGYLEAAQDGVAPLTTSLIDSLHEDTLLLQALVEDLQELTQAEAGRLQLELASTDMADLLASVANAHRARATTAGLTIELDLDALDQAEVDARRIRQVVTNLVENSIRHTQPGGKITLRARGLPAGELQLSVTDTGSGIAAEHLPHLFDRFYRVDSSRNRATGGSGLGLAITRELVTAHGGTIGVTSKAGVGTTFTIELPASVTAPAPPALAGRHDLAEAASGRTETDETPAANDSLHTDPSGPANSAFTNPAETPAGPPGDCGEYHVHVS